MRRRVLPCFLLITSTTLVVGISVTALSHSHGNAHHWTVVCGHCRTHALYVPLPAVPVAGVGAGRGPALLLLASATGVRCRKAFVTYLLTCGTHTYEIHSGRTRHSHTCPPGDHVTPTRASGDHEITAAPRPRLLDNRIEQSGPVCLLTLLGVQLTAVPATQPLTVAAFTPLVGVDT